MSQSQFAHAANVRKYTSARMGVSSAEHVDMMEKSVT